jgi:hypothetical protein
LFPLSLAKSVVRTTDARTVQVAENNGGSCRKNALSGFENVLRFNTSHRRNRLQESIMKSNQDLIGKTISGVVAVIQPDGNSREMWMLQFSDGTHVEFVSPSARRALRRHSRGKKPLIKRPSNDQQLALNVA